MQGSKGNQMGVAGYRKNPIQTFTQEEDKTYEFVKKNMNTLNATFINFFNKVTKTRFGSSHGSFSSCLSCLTNNPNGHQTTNCPKYGDIELKCAK
jgi:hypothetical protein